MVCLVFCGRVVEGCERERGEPLGGGCVWVWVLVSVGMAVGVGMGMGVGLGLESLC